MIRCSLRLPLERGRIGASVDRHDQLYYHKQGKPIRREIISRTNVPQVFGMPQEPIIRCGVFMIWPQEAIAFELMSNLYE
jgi:hypothetical protein